MRAPFSSTLLALAFALSLAACLPSRARACWDGFYAQVGDVSQMGGDTRWDLDAVRERARWLGRIDALLPDGASVTSEWGYVTVSVDGHDTDFEWQNGQYLTLFREVARVVGATPADVRRALRTETALYVVQAAAFREADDAATYAAHVSDRAEASHGFYEAGGFPADNPEAHVVTVQAPGKTHRVYVGAFVDRAEAAAMAQALGGHAFVREV